MNTLSSYMRVYIKFSAKVPGPEDSKNPSASIVFLYKEEVNGQRVAIGASRNATRPINHLLQGNRHGERV
jgi:hypothetical protein